MLDYFFTATEYIQVTRNADTGPGTVNGGPRPLSDWFGTASFGPIDAALYSGPYCYFFSGDQYVRVTFGPNGPSGAIDAGYPRPISDWNWPNNFGATGITAALNSWPYSFFFAGTEYIRVSRTDDAGFGTVDSGYPRPISTAEWGKRFGTHGIRGALYSNSKYYFFFAKEYIRVTQDGTDLGSLDSGYPAPISNWGWPAGFATAGILAALYTPGPLTPLPVLTVTIQGSETDNRFVVTDFSKTPPVSTFCTPPFAGGCLVDADGKVAAVASYQGTTVAIYDIANPSSPALTGIFEPGLQAGGFSGIGALSLSGKYLLVGEYAGPTLALLDITQSPNSAAATVSTINNNSFLDGGVLQMVLNGPLAVVAGQYDCYVIDFTNPNAPVQLPAFTFSADFEGPFACGFDGSTAAFGASNGNVQLYSIASGPVANLLGQFDSGFFNGVTSVGVMVNLVAVNFIGDGSVCIFDMGPPPQLLSQTLINTGNGSPGGALSLLALPVLALATNNGNGVILMNTANPAEPVRYVTAPNSVLNPGIRPTLSITGWLPFEL